MKKSLLSICLIIFTIIVQAQNYIPFLKGKTYRYLNPTDSTLLLQKIDSVSVTNNGDSIFYSFRKNLFVENSKHQIDIPFSPNNIHLNANKIVFNNNKITLIYISQTETDSLIFKLNTSINDVWKCKYSDYSNYKYFKYKGIKFMNFNTLTDSVKVFEAMTDSLSNDSITTIYLSKNYGFINGFNNYNLYSITELGIGLSKEINYSPSDGDTCVYVNCSNNYKGYLANINQSIFHSTSGYEKIINGKFNIYTQNDYFENHTSIAAIENIGVTEHLLISNQDGMPTCNWINHLVYYKGKAGEFGKRLELDKILGVNEITFDNFAKVYPNPSKGVINIDFSNSESKLITVIDLKGIELMNFNTSELQNKIILKSGIYMLKISTNNQIFTQKILIN